MAEVTKTEEGVKTPTLYTMYDKLYDFNDLQRTADLGLAEYLSSLKRGRKDESEFRSAYNNIMNGIKDGSIVYKDGRFVDSKYGYSNSPDKDKNRDHYGLMASYIFNKMGKSPEYVKPEDKTKIKWNGTASIGLALMRELYNSDTENVGAFVDIDRADLKSNKGRSNRLYTALNNVLSNFDNLFTGYSEADRTNYTGDAGYITEALKALQDGSFDAGDYLALTRAASGLNYSQMFTDGTLRAEAEERQDAKPPSQVLLFLQFMDENHPLHTFVDRGPLFDYNTASKIQLTPEALTAFNLVLSGMSDTLLYDILRRYIRTPKEATPFLIKVGEALTPISNVAAAAHILKYLQDNNKLTSYNFGEGNLGAFYLPGSWLKGGSSGLVWDTTTGKVSEMDYLKIPYLKTQILLEFNQWLLNRSSGGTETPHWLDSYGYYKKGGVIKAKEGWYAKLKDYTGEYDTEWMTSSIRNGDLTSEVEYPWSSESISKNDPGRYSPSEGNSRERMKAVEALLYFQDFTNALFNEDGSLTEVGIAFAHDIDRLLPKGSLASIYDENNELRKSWTVKSKNAYGEYEDVTYSNVKDYLTHGRNDLTLGPMHNLYRRMGKRYFYTDDMGNKHWVDPKEIKGYKVSEDPTHLGWEGNTHWYDYELTGKLEDPNNLPYGPDGVDEPYDGTLFNESTGEIGTDTDPTHINPVTGDHRRRLNLGFLSGLEEFAPDLLGAGRLALSLNTNNRVARTVKPSLTPVLKDAPWRYSPVTGAYGQMLYMENRGNDVLRQASLPFTSDASLTSARLLDALRLANQLKTEGYLADNQEIKRTQAEALARVEDNMVKRSEVANFNRASINQTNRERALLEAARLKSNWQSWDNYLLEIGKRRLAKWLERELASRTATKEALATDYLNAVSNLNTLYKESNPNATTSTMLSDSRYTEAVRALLQLYRYNTSRIGLDRWNDPYKNYKSRSYEDILGSYTFS